MQNSLRYIPIWFRLMLVASVAVVAYGLGSLADQPVEGRSEDLAKLSSIKDTLWVDKLPEMMHDEWKGYIFTPDNVGLNIKGHSAFKLTLEIFEFQVRRNNLKWHFPHDGSKTSTKFTVEKLKKPTEHFDRKLTIEADPRNDGKTTEYFTGPELANGATIEQLAPGALSRLKAYQPAQR